MHPLLDSKLQNEGLTRKLIQSERVLLLLRAFNTFLSLFWIIPLPRLIKTNLKHVHLIHENYLDSETSP